MSKRKTKEEFINESIIKHGDGHYDYSLLIYKNNNTKVKLICNIHKHLFEVRPNDHLSKNVGCTKCNNGGLGKKKKFFNNLLNRFKKTHGNKYDYSFLNYVNSDSKIKIICPEHGEFEQTPRHHYNGRGCPSCAGVKPYNNESFIKKAKEIHGNKYDYSKIEYVNLKTKIKIICPEHGEFEQTPNTHLRTKYGCRKCLSYKKDDFIKQSNLIHNNKYDYSLVKIISNQKRVQIICPIHGLFEQKLINHVKGNGCQRCNDSKGEKIITKFLKENYIDYEREKTFKDCKDKKLLKFDFYIPKLNMCIEYDGEYHFIPHWSKNGVDVLKNIKIRDIIKNDYCINNDIKLLRIKFDQVKDIKKILTKNILNN
jgi:hypothetical protein